jgi:hypothetical protein
MVGFCALIMANMKKRYKKAIETWFNNIQLDGTLYSCENQSYETFEINLMNDKKIFIAEYFHHNKDLRIDIYWMDNYNNEIFSSIYNYIIKKIKLTKVEEILINRIEKELEEDNEEKIH